MSNPIQTPAISEDWEPTEEDFKHPFKVPKGWKLEHIRTVLQEVRSQAIEKWQKIVDLKEDGNHHVLMETLAREGVPPGEAALVTDDSQSANVGACTPVVSSQALPHSRASQQAFDGFLRHIEDEISELREGLDDDNRWIGLLAAREAVLIADLHRGPAEEGLGKFAGGTAKVLISLAAATVAAMASVTLSARVFDPNIIQGAKSAILASGISATLALASTVPETVRLVIQRFKDDVEIDWIRSSWLMTWGIAMFLIVCSAGALAVALSDAIEVARGVFEAGIKQAS